nr:divalent cation tolerance protein CutA [uncultured Cohaesibacter sp.]
MVKRRAPSAVPCLEAKLVACVNILTGMTALFQWQDHLVECGEAVLIAKSRCGVWDEVARLHEPGADGDDVNG